MSGCAHALPAQIICGELHYPRIPHEYWRARLAMARAMGLNAISTYVFWNRHEPEPGRYDFAAGNDVARFVRIAQEERLWVVLRPGPYVCAEWDLGGLPWWLLQSDGIALRSSDRRFMHPVRRWLTRLGAELAPLQRAHGGPIIAVQLENEYGAFGSDREYLAAVRAHLQTAGFGVSPLYTIDQPGDLARGALDDVAIGVTFAPGDPGTQFRQLRALRPNAPLVCAEYWAGWFDHWGEPHARLDDEQQVRDLAWMLKCGASVNIYMFHGGTNFGFWNGANAFDPHTYQPTTTSYDYQAALDEAGCPTPKYWRFREVIERHTQTALPCVPDPPAAMAIEKFYFDACASLFDLLGEPLAGEVPLNMEAVGAPYGFALYRTRIPARGRAVLRVEVLHDYAIVLVDGRIVGRLDRRTNELQLELEADEGMRLDLLVENCGRINYGPQLQHERKGILGEVYWNERALRRWQMYGLPLQSLAVQRWCAAPAPGPALYRACIRLNRTADTFLDTGDLHKGVLWVNGHNAGRFWNIGPQRSLYIPATWLRRGENEIVVLELADRTAFPAINGRERPLH